MAGAAAAAAAGLIRPARAVGGDAVIGLSNGYFGTEWRNQMIAGAQQQFDGYKAKGLAGKLVVQQAGADVNQQIQDIRNMIRQGVAVIAMNPNSPVALNGVVNEAKRAGIPVISFDQAITNPYAINVAVDHYQWGQRYAEWIAKTLDGRGKVVVMDGIPGHPATRPPKRAGKPRSTPSSSIPASRSSGPATACGTTPRRIARWRPCSRRSPGSTALLSRTPWASASCAPSRMRAATSPS